MTLTDARKIHCLLAQNSDRKTLEGQRLLGNLVDAFPELAPYLPSHLETRELVHEASRSHSLGEYLDILSS